MSCYQTLKEMGYRLTPQRVAVLETLHEFQGHMTAEEIYSRARAMHPNVNRSTIYRTLTLLKKLGLVAETDFGDGRIVYEHFEKYHHHHLVCQKCGKIVEVDESVLAPFNELVIRRFRFVPDMRHLAIRGHCLDCQD